eukprot:353893-Chlamydomonas_euryale.AAC.18
MSRSEGALVWKRFGSRVACVPGDRSRAVSIGPTPRGRSIVGPSGRALWPQWDHWAQWACPWGILEVRCVGKGVKERHEAGRWVLHPECARGGTAASRGRWHCVA